MAKSAEEYVDAFGENPVGCIMRMVVVVVILSVLGSVGGLVLYPLTQGKRIFEKTLDADNVIYNYEWFKRQFREVGAIDKKIVSQQTQVKEFGESAGPRRGWTFEDKTEHARIRSIVTGLEQQRADMVAEYNARAAMANRDIFMGDDCPEYLE
jgi:hypothetical protein